MTFISIKNKFLKKLNDNPNAKKTGYIDIIIKFSNKSTFIVILIIIIAILIDTSITNIYRFIPSQPSSILNIAIFTVMIIVYAVGQYIILEFVKSKSKKIRSSEQLRLKIIHKMVSIVQYLLIASLVFVTLQMIVTSEYSVAILTTVIGISYILAIIMLGLLVQRFFSWFKSSRNSVVLTYGIAITMLSINAGFTLVYVANLLMSQPTYVLSATGHHSAFSVSDPIFNLVYLIFSIGSFMLTWLATVLLLRYYSRKLGRAKYWIIVSIPLMYFLSQYQPIFLYVFSEYRMSEPILFGILYTLIFSLSKLVGGILFCIAFWSVARTVRDSPVRDYMIISAYGLLLLFISNQATVLVNSSYPPFGLITISFVGLSSYLMLVGVYSSAVSVAQDIKLRQYIRKSVQQQSTLLDKIGTSEMEQEIQKKVIKITKDMSDQIVEQTGIQSSLEEEDVKEYLNKAIEEVKVEKERTKSK